MHFFGIHEIWSFWLNQMTNPVVLTELKSMKWDFTFFTEPKRATIDFGHFGGFWTDILKFFIKIRSNKLSLKGFNWKVNFFRNEYIFKKVLLSTRFSKKFGTIIIKPYREKPQYWNQIVPGYIHVINFFFQINFIYSCLSYLYLYKNKIVWLKKHFIVSKQY